MSWDFAQAALLVQNSSAVYCRKVDYFSSLVVKALEGFQHSIDEAGLSNARGGARGSSNRGGASGGATDEDRAFWGLLRDDNYDFLTLDDVMPVAKPSDITRGTAARRKNDRRASLGTLSMSFYTQQQSTLPSLSQQQMASVNQRASSSHLASSLLDHLDAGRTGALEDAPYRVPKYHALNLVGSKCEVTPKGALLLPGVAEASGRRRGGRGSVPVVVQATVDCETNGTPSHKSSPAGTAGHEPGGTENDADFPVASDDRYDDDDDGPGFDFGGHDDDDEVHDENQNAPPPQQQQKAGVLRTAQNVATQHKKSVTFNDPWELLDPHQPMGNHRPLKKGMTLVVPDGLYNLPSDCVTGARTKRRTGKENSKALGRASQSSSEKGSPNGPLSESYATDMYRNLTEGTDLPQMSLTDMAFGEEFAYIRKQNRRIQMAEKRKARQSARGAADVDAWDGPHDAVEDDRDADFGGFDDGIDDDDYDDYERDDSGGGGGIVWGDDEGPNTGNAGLASVEDAFHGDGTFQYAILNVDVILIISLLSFSFVSSFTRRRRTHLRGAVPGADPGVCQGRRKVRQRNAAPAARAEVAREAAAVARGGGAAASLRHSRVRPGDPRLDPDRARDAQRRRRRICGRPIVGRRPVRGGSARPSQARRPAPVLGRPQPLQRGERSHRPRPEPAAAKPGDGASHGNLPSPERPRNAVALRTIVYCSMITVLKFGNVRTTLDQSYVRRQCVRLVQVQR